MSKNTSQGREHTIIRQYRPIGGRFHHFCEFRIPTIRFDLTRQGSFATLKPLCVKYLSVEIRIKFLIAFVDGV